MTATRVLTYEEVLEQVHGLTRQVNILRELVLNIRFELGEPFAHRPGEIHSRLETLEGLDKSAKPFAKRMDT